ncbi:hypothetical protein H112_06800 [Trichophyton rubrum D6]|uniref:Uncharacterized protein n=3 Tax=Trichophyton TaxID=5550 RepID=A0A080WF09_TRIRC|nr:uncharacterized protein TERG_11811 [Trichophyton rubrum CBS 118892]EZF12177.1 hypothetical protein H100_06822 [Trichophyton rubrum MR850]EZF39034.1 hypothetical protein H102_06783 [Trichophyton rubrum CBS 100081]EZF49674.1 hypothetical protein H103_06808 [Trichophyton rubrum CBS 288.86]EZF60312.1 hypothetical protein H104_06762 [Trichophyton rubrum CBS 289.86]EZF70908.1 hypothetical protein H105_06823 [Trichophyton soudanense CBS 452.61]EZF81587.1 hypothetical protein H110_06804 [Trichophy
MAHQLHLDPVSSYTHGCHGYVPDNPPSRLRSGTAIRHLTTVTGRRAANKYQMKHVPTASHPSYRGRASPNSIVRWHNVLRDVVTMSCDHIFHPLWRPRSAEHTRTHSVPHAAFAGPRTRRR